jgi:hypothetical protein
LVADSVADSVSEIRYPFSPLTPSPSKPTFNPSRSRKFQSPLEKLSHWTEKYEQNEEKKNAARLAKLEVSE